MAVWHGDKGKKVTGGSMNVPRKKRKAEMGSLPIHTKIGKEKKMINKTKGGSMKIKACSAEFANVLDRKTNKTRKVRILDVIQNPANSQLVRSKIITKGCVIKTEIGNARIIWKGE